MKRILIAHQSTIPHYRVPFYDALERFRPDSWCFDVVFDLAELDKPQFFGEPVDIKQFDFSLLPVKTYSARIGEKRISYQTFWRRATNYDLIIVENAVNNLTYPLSQLHQLHGAKYAYWGHGRDRSVTNTTPFKTASERLKLLLARKANGFFAYTDGVKEHLLQRGLRSKMVFVVNNTIDIDEQREAFDKWYPHREAIRKKLDLTDKKVLLFVGRFKKYKRLDLLLEAFILLHQKDPNFHLLLVGSGNTPDFDGDSGDISYLGPIVDIERLAQVYVASDVFAIPGGVGLGPLQAMCYDLPIMTIDGSLHGPEIDYLSPLNSIILDRQTTPAAYADSMTSLFLESGRLNMLRSQTWPSIQHLTIDQMANRFIKGINTILEI